MASYLGPREYAWVECPFCYRQVTTSKAGVMRTHNTHRGRGADECRGARQTVAATQADIERTGQ